MKQLSEDVGLWKRKFVSIFIEINTLHIYTAGFKLTKSTFYVHKFLKYQRYR